MTSPAFRHPLARHPVVGPLLTLLDCEVSADVRAEPGLWAEVRIARHLALLRFVDWAGDRMIADAAAAGLSLFDASNASLPDGYGCIPKHLLPLLRPSQTGVVGSPLALRIVAQLERDGPEGVTAPQPDVATRRLARSGVWPGPPAIFVGRLDDEVGPDVYTPSVTLVRHLAGQRRWHEASRIARRLPRKLAFTAEVEVLRARVRAGLTIAEHALSPPHLDALHSIRAQIALEQGNAAAAQENFERIVRPGARAQACTQLARAAIEQWSLPQLADRWLNRPEMPAGDRMLLKAQHQAHNRNCCSAIGWAHEAAARSPRRCHRHWSNGLRPDLELAQAILHCCIQDSRAFAWPWSAATSRGLLDDLDAMTEVVRLVGPSRATAAAAQRCFGPEALRRRVRQVAVVTRLNAIDWASKGPRPAQCPRAQAFVRGLFGDEAHGRGLPTDPCHPERAFYDDGVARSARGRARRKVIVNASKQALRAARAAPSDPDRQDAAEVRLASLARLGGGRAQRVLEDHLQEGSADHPLARPALDALIEVAPRALLTPEMTAAVSREGSGYVLEVLDRLERQAALPAGYSGCTRRLLERLAEAQIERPAAWWADLCRSVWAQRRAPPSVPALEYLQTRPDRALHQPATHLLSAATQRAKALSELAQDTWLGRMVERPDDLAISMAWHDGSRFTPSWSKARWWEYFRWLSREPGNRPIPAMVSGLVRSLGVSDAEEVTQALLHGRPPRPSLRSPIEVESSSLQLRYLDKVRDAFTFLRFADSVTCCFNSRSRYYDQVGASVQIRRLWRDPLSYVFVLESTRGPTRLRGFVFGGFGRSADGVPGLLLNGLYLQRNVPKLRAAVLRALEERFARPLGSAWIGIGNQHGGEGAMPAGYELGTQTVRRLRALADNRGHVHRRIYDDIGRVVNRDMQARLCWRRIEA